jgi:hypothetical protein
MSMRIGQLGVAAGAALLLTACAGGPLDGKTGPEVAAAAADALDAAGAVHVTGTMTEDGKDGAVDMDLQGKDSTGTLTVSGVELQLRSVDGTVYLQAPADFWASSGLSADGAAKVDGKWVIVPDEAAAQFAEFSLDGIVADLRKPDSKIKDDVTSAESHGKPVVVVEHEDGSTLSVLNDEPAYLVTMTDESDSSEKLTFSRFGEKQTIEAPADAMDLSELTPGG